VRTAIFRVSLLVLCCAAGGSLLAQEGHPLKGSWIGTWGPSKAHSNDIILTLNWDGKVITGMINPGTDNMEVKSASLIPTAGSYISRPTERTPRPVRRCIT